MDPESLEWRVAAADLRLCLAQRRLGLVLDEMVRKYRPDQPRAPKGTPEGGNGLLVQAAPDTADRRSKGSGSHWPLGSSPREWALARIAC